MNKGLLEKYAAYLPVNERTPKLSLGEGNTPLVYAEQLSKQLSATIYLKVEGANPTGSFKDRGMVMAVAKAKEEGATARYLRFHGQYLCIRGRLCQQGWLGLLCGDPPRLCGHGETGSSGDVWC